VLHAKFEGQPLLAKVSGGAGDTDQGDAGTPARVPHRRGSTESRGSRGGHNEGSRKFQDNKHFLEFRLNSNP